MRPVETPKGLGPDQSSNGQGAPTISFRMSSDSRSSRVGLLILTSAGILAYGMIAALAGSIVPQLSKQLGLSPAQIGNLFLAQAIGMIVASIAAGPFVDLKGKKIGLSAALSLLALSLFSLPHAGSYFLILLVMIALGVGGGSLTTVTSALLSDVNPPRRATILTLTKSTYGIGGFLTPFAGALFFAGKTISLCYWIGFFTLILSWMNLRAPIPPPSPDRRLKWSRAGELMRRPLLPLLCLMMFLYVSCEVGCFNWLPKYLVSTGMPVAAALRAVSLGFAIGLIAGRVLFAAVLMRISAASLTIAAGALMAVSTYALFHVNGALTIPFAFLAGLAMAPVFPSVVSIVGDHFPKLTGTAIGMVVTSGWIGLAVSSRVIGVIAGTDPKRIKTGLLLLPLFSLALTILAILVRFRTQRPAIERGPAALPQSVSTAYGSTITLRVLMGLFAVLIAQRSMAQAPAAQAQASVPPSQPGSSSAARHGGIPPAPDQAAVDRGQKLFSQNCSFCHGKDANGGDGGPDLIRSVLVNHDENGNLIAPVVLNGRPEKGMPKFDLTPAQISDIATFLHARNRYVRYRQLYQVKGIVVGNPKAGQIYFARACAQCHSPTGDLAHVASQLDEESLMRRFLYPAAHAGDNSAAAQESRPTVMVTLPSGETMSGKLAHIDEFSVSLYDSEGTYHSWPLNQVKANIHDPLAGHLQLLHAYTDDDMHNILAYLETLK